MNEPEVIPNTFSDEIASLHQKIGELEQRCTKAEEALRQLKSKAEEELRQAHDELEKATEKLEAKVADFKQTEEELHVTQQILQTVVDRMPTAVALIRGSDLRVQLVNPAYRTIAPGKEMVGHTLDEIWPETGQNFTVICRRVLDTGEPHQVVDELNTIRRQPGGPPETRYFSWSLHRVRLPGDQGWGLLIAARETTARKQVEEALNESRRKYQDLIETTGDFIWEMDSQGRYTYCSPQMETLWGITPEAMIGKTPFDVMPPEEIDGVLKEFKKIASSAVPFRGLTTTALNSQGQWIFLETNGVPFFDRNGRFLGFRGITRDITERKQAEEKLRKAYDELEQRVLERTRELITVNKELRAEITERERAEAEAISNAKLAEGLAQSIIALNTSLELEHVLDTILEQLYSSVPYTIAAITLIEDDVARVVRHTSLEGHPEAARALEFNDLLMSYPLQQKLQASQQPIFIEDIAMYPDWIPVPGVDWIQSYMAAPLVVGGQFKGTIHLISDQPRAFNQETVSRVMAFAAPAALAVHNARLYAAESHARRVAEAISDMSLALNQATNLDVFLRIILDYLPRLASYKGAYIVTLDDEANLKLRVTAGFVDEIDPKRKDGASFPMWEISYIQEVITTKKSLLIRDTRKYPGWETLVTRSEIRSWMGIPILLGDKVLGIVGLVHTSPESFSEEQLHFLESIASQVSVAIQNAWLFEQVQAGQERFELLSRKLVEAQESERRYIARELHDETNQALTAIMLGLRSIEQEASQPEKVLAKTSEVKKLADEVLESLHRLAVNLRPATLDHLGLVPALEQLVKDMAERYCLNIRFKSGLPSQEGRLPDQIETALYRIVQEALTNAAWHAHARNVDVILEYREGKVLAMVEDDGVGFDPTEIRESDKLGLVGIQERARSMGGKLQIESAIGKGTTVVVEVEYKP